MNSKLILYGIIGFLGGVLLTLFFTSNAVNSNNTSMMRMMGMGAGNVQTGTQQYGMASIDAHFIEQMIPHHEDAITMANLALERAEHDEIKTLSQNIMTSQSSEIDKMKEWYKNWYGKEVPADEVYERSRGMMKGGGMHMGRMGDESDIDDLKNAENFDKVFIEEMIPHHQMAVMMASMLKNGTDRPEMKQLADDIIKAQTEEIEAMRNWYKDWGYE